MNNKQRQRLREVAQWYGTLPQDDRMKLQEEFGHFGEPDRETKFHMWLNKTKYTSVLRKGGVLSGTERASK